MGQPVPTVHAADTTPTTSVAGTDYGVAGAPYAIWAKLPAGSNFFMIGSDFGYDYIASDNTDQWIITTLTDTDHNVRSTPKVIVGPDWIPQDTQTVSYSHWGLPPKKLTTMVFPIV